MYATTTEALSPYFQAHNLNTFLFQDMQTLSVSDYNLWGVEDLFRAPEPIIDEPMISSFEDLFISPQSLTVSDVESSIESGQLLSEVFYECHKDLLAKDGTLPEQLGKSISSVSLGLVEDKVSFLDFGAVYGMRRAFSEGDMKTLENNVSSNNTRLLVGQPSKFKTSEERREKLSRYRSKKSKRNFDRKIKYACRKALADSQPRVRGRFAKTEVSESCKN